MADIVLSRISKKYGRQVTVDDVSLEIAQGELVALVGPSGCGKTTTLRMVAGLTEASSGRILFGGRDVSSLPTYRRNTGMVFQGYALFPHMTVADNIAFGLQMRGVRAGEAARRVAEALEMVRLAPYADRFPRELSGGQQQRVALAREPLPSNPTLCCLMNHCRRSTPSFGSRYAARSEGCSNRLALPRSS